MKAFFAAIVAAAVTSVTAHCMRLFPRLSHPAHMHFAHRHAARPHPRRCGHVGLGVCSPDRELRDQHAGQYRLALARRCYADADDALQVTDVTSELIRCYETDTASQTSIATVSAGDTVGFKANGDFYHPGVCRLSDQVRAFAHHR